MFMRTSAADRPFRMAGSLSTHSTLRPLQSVGVAGAAVRLATCDARPVAGATVTRNTVPRPGREDRLTVSPRISAILATMERPSPTPPSPAPRPAPGRRTNSANTLAWLSGAMPTPVSQTSSRRRAPSFRQPTSTPPDVVYCRALLIRFCSTERTRSRSERTRRAPPTKRKVSPLARACGPNSRDRSSNTASRAKDLKVGFTPPASSLERFSSARKSRWALSMDWSEWRTSSACAGWPATSLASAARNSRAAWSGCNRSWLAAARKRVFDAVAASASALASVSASVRSITRVSSCSLAVSSALMAPRSSVISV